MSQNPVENLEKTLEKRVEYRPVPIMSGDEAAKRFKNGMNRTNRRNFREDKVSYITQLEKVLSHKDFPASYGVMLMEKFKKIGKPIKKTKIYTARRGVAVHWDILIEMGKLVGIEIELPESYKAKKDKKENMLVS